MRPIVFCFCLFEFSSKVKLVTPAITKKIVKSYHESKKRLLLLDYDGTLVGFNENPEKD